MRQTILIRQDSGDVATLTMNAPEQLNALSDAMLAALRQAFADLMQDQQIRVVILQGAGRVFCAGHDLREMQAARNAADGGAAAFAALFARCAEVMQMIPRLPQPVIAQVHGIATAAGCQLVASCDMAIAAEGTRFGVNGINLGLFCTTPMVALTRTISRKAAFELLTTGDFIDAGRAAELGLINRVVPEADLAAATAALAATLARKLAPALQLGKRSFHAQIDLPLADAYALAGQRIVENMLWPETEEGIRAFLERRPPRWREAAASRGIAMDITALDSDKAE